jgi:uncharacterized protein YbbK (DUF523 family)
MSADRPKLLVSACLLGRPVRYDGAAKTLHDECLVRWVAEGRVVAACPEVMAGLPIPRPPAEIAETQSGSAVLRGTARIIETDGADVSDRYIQGARTALALALAHGCRFALLTDGSPSCGVTFIYDGTFKGRRHAGEGVTTALLRQHGIEVFSPHSIAELAQLMDQAPGDPA